jgi:hypothetical protein
MVFKNALKQYVVGFTPLSNTSYWCGKTVNSFSKHPLLPKRNPRLLENTDHSDRACTVFARSNTANVGSDPTWGIDMSVRVCADLCAGSSLATGWYPVQESYRLQKIKKLKKRPRSNKGLYSHRQIDRLLEKGEGRDVIKCLSAIKRYWNTQHSINLSGL